MCIGGGKNSINRVLTDAEIIELEELLRLQEVDNLFNGLTNFNDKTSPNYKFLHDSIVEKTLSGCVLEGSSRSSKTWGGVDTIIWICTEVETNCTINIYRETYNEFKTTLYDDFKRRLDDFGLPNKFHDAEDVKSFKIGDNKIFFLGCDKVGKAHGGGCDYAFFNEAMQIPQRIFKQVIMRCRKFWWMDYNPSFTDHWVFNSVVTRKDVGFLRTTFLDNHYISDKEKIEILASEPWLPNSYEVEDGQLIYNYLPITKHNQPPPHPTNVENGTADDFHWKVYGLGLRGAMKGVIFEHITWIDEFPDVAYTYGNDFGFTADPNAFGRYAEDENNIWAELLIYQPIETPEELAATYDALGIEKDLPIACDSSDKYTGENKGTVEMVRGLQDLGYTEAFKISKTKSVMYWLLSMKKKKIHVVKNDLWIHVKKERENYKFKEVNGILINQPVDKWNHFFDMIRYNHIAHNSGLSIETEWQ